MDRTRLGIVTACTVGTMVSMTPAVHSVFGIFLIPLSETFGWPRAAISGVLGVVAVTSAVALPIAGRFADRHGVRGLVLAGNVLLAIAIGLLALTDGSLWRFYATFAFIAVAGSLPSSPLFSKIVSEWFDRRRGAMLGITAGMGNALGAILMPVAAAIMMPQLGWRGTYLGIAAIVLLLGFPFLFALLREAPAAAPAAAGPAPAAGGAGPMRGAGLTLREAARTRTFWLLIVAIAVGAGCLTAVFSHVVPILAERGIDVATATAVISVFALVTAGAQITLGIALDKLPSARLTAPLYLVAVAGLAVCATATGRPALLLGGAMLGIGLGTQYGALPYFVARYFGLRSFGTIIGVMYSAVTLAQGVTPVLLDHGFDVEGTYRTALIGIGIALTAGAALLLFLPAYRDPATPATADA